MFEPQRQRLLQSLDAAHAVYYRAETFGGPSLYFHLRALEAGKAGDLELFADRVYALLTSWGMHRMGSGGSKMREFEEFRASLVPLWPNVLKLQHAITENLSQTDWHELHDVFCGIRCMRTGTSLVGNSKVMAHALPNIVAPVDREYTLRFLFKNTNIANDLGREWEKLRTILQEFFHPMLQEDAFKIRARGWLERQDQFPGILHR